MEPADKEVRTTEPVFKWVYPGTANSAGTHGNITCNGTLALLVPLATADISLILRIIEGLNTLNASPSSDVITPYAKSDKPSV